jgi:uncharacterized protein (DUF58 family)
LEWTVIRRLDGMLQGDYRTFFRGFGLDLAEMREYQFNDDVRYIDWNVTARLQTPHVRQYNEDREITAWFLLDVSPSVDFGSAGITKRDVLTDFVGVMATVLARHGNRIGAMYYGESVDTTAHARGGRLQVLHVLDLLDKRPRMSHAPETNLNNLFVAAINAIKRRSVIFIVSDFFSAPGWGKALGHLSTKHEVVAIRLTDPLETELPDFGPMYMTDAESGEQVLIDTHDSAFRHRFASLAREREGSLREEFIAAGVDAIELSTRDDLVEALFRYTMLRKQQSMLLAGSSLPLSRI